MGRSVLQSPWTYINKDEYAVADDFTHWIDADEWTVLHADGGATVTHEGPGRSWINMEIKTTDNDEAAIVTTNELFKFITLVPIHVTARIQYTEVNTDDANVAFGLADAIGANFITDDGAALAIANEGAVIYKLDGDTTWRFATEMDTVQTTSQSTTTAGGATPQVLEIDIIPTTATTFQARPFVNGVQLLDSTSGDPIMHTITLGTATDMDLGVYGKTGAAQEENIRIDYIIGQQGR